MSALKTGLFVIFISELAKEYLCTSGDGSDCLTVLISFLAPDSQPLKNTAALINPATASSVFILNLLNTFR